ncbi:MAG: hypothetical protein OSA51_12770 [Octadecabacter sp.]|nr:hypothetical protein [Octadecabacter sp.]
MRLILVLFTLPAANPAMAHIGHLGDIAGHGHWAAAGAIAIALGIAALGARKGKTRDTDATDEKTTDEEKELA